MSMQARGKTGSPLRADSLLSPSNQETFKAVLARLQTDPHTLEVWIDRFREWLSSQVMGPLLRNIASAHLVCPPTHPHNHTPPHPTPPTQPNPTQPNPTSPRTCLAG